MYILDFLPVPQHTLSHIYFFPLWETQSNTLAWKILPVLESYLTLDKSLLYLHFLFLAIECGVWTL